MTALKTLIFTVFVPGTVTVLVPRLLLSSDFELASMKLRSLGFFGGIFILLGVLIYLRCAWDFTFAGKGTPAPIDPPKELVAQGLYRFVRNPMYLGVLLILFGEAMLFESRTVFVYAAVVFSFFHLFVVLYEEPALQRQFGVSYQRYCSAVPRWIPNFRKMIDQMSE